MEGSVLCSVAWHFSRMDTYSGKVVARNKMESTPRSLADIFCFRESCEVISDYEQTETIYDIFRRQKARGHRRQLAVCFVEIRERKYPS